MGKQNEVTEITLMDIVADYAWHEMGELRKEGFSCVEGDIAEDPFGNIDVRIRASSGESCAHIDFTLSEKAEK